MREGPSSSPNCTPVPWLKQTDRCLVLLVLRARGSHSYTHPRLAKDLFKQESLDKDAGELFVNILTDLPTYGFNTNTAVRSSGLALKNSICSPRKEECFLSCVRCFVPGRDTGVHSWTFLLLFSLLLAGPGGAYPGGGPRPKCG